MKDDLQAVAGFCAAAVVVLIMTALTLYFYHWLFMG